MGPSSRAGTRSIVSPAALAFCAFLVVAAFFLWTEHRAHLFGWLPYLILLACPVIHLFMHRGHGTAGEAASRRHSQGDGS
ncbi:MAG: DUF2933 domain-containing protein [Vicinamibacterales bacterium]